MIIIEFVFDQANTTLKTTIFWMIGCRRRGRDIFANDKNIYLQFFDVKIGLWKWRLEMMAFSQIVFIPIFIFLHRDRDRKVTSSVRRQMTS